MGAIDKIILSSNEDPTYLEFWKPVSWAYKMMGYDVELALLTNRDDNSEIVKECRKHGDVTLFKPVPHIGEFAQAKMIRYLLASQQGEKVCYIDDIDLFPLSKDFIDGKVRARPKDHLLCVGGEVYTNNGCYPASQMTAEGYIWKEIINPSDLPYEKLVEKWDEPPTFDRREKISIPLDMANDNYFSDERLLRRLITYSGVKKFEMQRGYGGDIKDVLDNTLDRYDWRIDQNKLDNHGYLNAHCSRPYGLWTERLEPLIEYIKKTYGTK